MTRPNDLSLQRGFAAGAVFDRIAATYDQEFTETLIGRAQRNAVWRVLLKTFRANENVLEINCGTGEDAFHLASNGVSVFACDASKEMICRAEERLQRETAAPPVVFCHLPTERISELDPSLQFDGAFSNFSGLNCVADLTPVALHLSRLVRPQGSLVLCFSTRYCAMEMLYYLLRGQVNKALRRCGGESEVRMRGAGLKVYYPTVRQIRRSFAPYFHLRSVRGVGVAIPPSYLEPWARRNGRFLSVLTGMERTLGALPVLRTTGDHVLLRFERVAS